VRPFYGEGPSCDYHKRGTDRSAITRECRCIIDFWVHRAGRTYLGKTLANKLPKVG
jgi:hypothetical protein